MGFNAACLVVFALSISYAVCAEELTGNWYTVYEQNEGSRVKRELVDLHNGEFCVDVSEWGDIEYTEVARDKCDSTFEKVCEMKTERVCGEVTEIECDIVPYTICRMDMNVTKYKSWQDVPKDYTRKACTEDVMTVEHEKMMPNCKNVTKLNCVTLWKTDENGKQVWAGNEDCEPVTWRECKLEAVKVGFKVPKMNCAEVAGKEGAVPFKDIEEIEKETMTTSMTCTVESATDCKPKVSEKCNAVEYMECHEVPTELCNKETIQEPTQTYEHKKKCLLPDDGSIQPRQQDGNDIEGSGATNDIDTSESRRESQSQGQPGPGKGYLSPREGRKLPKSLEQQALETRRLQQLRQQQQQIILQQQRQARTFRGHAGQPRFQNRKGQAANSRRFQQGQFNQGK